MIYVNYFVSFSKLNGEEELSVFLERIKKGDFKEKVSQVRKLFAEGKVEEAQKLKKTLPAVTISALYDGTRKEANMKLYQAVSILDYDNQEKKFLNELLKSVNSDPHTLASFISPSGKGLKVLVRTEPNQGELSQAPAEVKVYHKAAYKQVVEYYNKLTGASVDISGKDSTRLCFASFDPNLYVNLDSAPIVVVPEEAESSQAETPQERVFRLAYNNISQSMTYQGGQRNNFIYYLANLLNRKGLPKEVTTKFFVDKFVDLDVKEITSVIESAYKHVEDHGVLMMQNKKDIVSEIEKYLREHYEFRYNVVVDMIEARKKNSDEKFVRIADREENTIWRKLHLNGISAKINDLRLLLNSDFAPNFDPFVDYIENLPEWDGHDYISQFASTISVDSESDYWVFCLRKWLTAMVASLLQTEVVNHTVLVLIGEQGVGKTMWCKKIYPPELRQYYTIADLKEKSSELLIKFSQFAGINIDEMGMFNQQEILKLNKLVSQEIIDVRKVYAHNRKNYVRRASLLASTNIEQILVDPSGSRRFPTFKVTDINYLHTINYPQLYAQIKNLLDNGFQFWYNKLEIKELNKHNERFVFYSSEEEFLLTYFTKNKIHKKPESLTASEILRRISARTGVTFGRMDVSVLGKILHKHGFEYRKTNRGRFYKVYEIGDGEVAIRNQFPDKPLPVEEEEFLF